MTKAELVNTIVLETGINKKDVLAIVESLMAEVKNALEREEPVYLRGFGSFIIKHRAEKTARNITKNTTLIVPAQYSGFQASKGIYKRGKQNEYVTI